MVLSKNFQDIIQGAIYLAVNELNHQYLTCEHILFCALDNKDVIKMFENFDINISGLRNKLYQFLQYDLYDLTNKNFENCRVVKLRFTDHLVNFFEKLVLNKNKIRNSSCEIEIEDFILEILFDYDSYSHYFLKKFNLSPEDIITFINKKRNDYGDNSTQINKKNNQKKQTLKDFGGDFSDFDNDDFLNKDKKTNGSEFSSINFEENNTLNDGKYLNDIGKNQSPSNNKYFSNYFGFESGYSSNQKNSNNAFSQNNQNFNGGVGGFNSFGSHNGSHYFNDDKEKSKNSILENYCVNFNLAAKNGKIDPIFDRDTELSALLKALYCRRKGNVLLIGDSGVGKTAIIEYLAQKIVNNDQDIPKRIKSALIYSLDLNSLISGTRYRGDLEERMKFLMNEIENSKQKIILFIDEIHTVIGTGSTNNGTLDIGNILKPYLARSMIYCIGATTRKEFTQFLSKDKAFLRRFQIIFVNEPSIESAQKMIYGIIGKYESYHNVRYTKAAIDASVSLSKRYTPDRNLPDGALDLIDYAGSSACIDFEKKKNSEFFENSKFDMNNLYNIESCSLEDQITLEDNLEEKFLDDKIELNDKNQSIPIITRKDIEDAVAEIVKIPKKQISSSAFAKNLLDLKDFLNQKIIGQEEAVEAVCKSILTSQSDLNLTYESRTKPMASYIFYGPTGVGKTELAIQLASYLTMKFIRIDMSEFSEAHSVSKLFGAPPGYVGFEQSGVLTEQVLKNPHCVILFDEIEKAHPNLMNSLLQILDYGNLTDNFGQKVNFSHAIIICTTNSGSRSMSKITPGFDSSGNKEVILKELESTFSPEFRNRFSSIISFKYLDKSVISKIIQNKFNQISNKLKKKNIELQIDKNIENFIIEKKYDYSMGARIIDRIFEDEIISKLSELFFRFRLTKKTQIKKVIFDLDSKLLDENLDPIEKKNNNNVKISLI